MKKFVLSLPFVYIERKKSIFFLFQEAIFRKRRGSFLLFVILLLNFLKGFSQDNKTPGVNGVPNFIVILIDDLGYGDIEPFGSVINKTPHLNRMAEEGLMLTSFYSAASVCSPARAGLMTGSYPKRIDMARGSWGTVLFPKDSKGLNPEEKTIAELLKDTGYTTGCFGKWHLGDQPEFLPLNHGFDQYFGIPYSNDMWPLHPNVSSWKSGACPLPLLRNNEVVDIVENMDDQALLCKQFTDEATSFIRENKEKPFFVYLSHAFVHHPRLARKRFMDNAGSQEEFNEQKLIRDREYAVRQRTRAQIEEVDWSVGRILNTLHELGLAENTLVLLTSDNGGALGSSNSPLRGYKGSTWEGGMRVPTIAWWPGTIEGGTSKDAICSLLDILPTLTYLSRGKMPDDRIIDGKNIVHLLTESENNQSPHLTFFYHGRQSNLEAVRSGKWKLHVNGALYNLNQDIGETTDVARENPEVVKRCFQYLEKHRTELSNPKNCRPSGKNSSPEYLVPLKN